MNNTEQYPFEDRLLHSLKGHKPRSGKRAGGITAAGAFAALAIVGGIAFSQMTAAPSFAIDEQANGDVKVTVNDVHDVQALEGALRDEGVNVKVNEIDFAEGVSVADTTELSTDPTQATEVNDDARDDLEVTAEASTGGSNSMTFTVDGAVVEAGILVTIDITQKDLADDSGRFWMTVSVG